MADAEAVILLAIEKLDSLLHQKTDLRAGDLAKLRSLRSEKKDLVVGMAEVWENDKEMLYRMVVEMAEAWDINDEEDEELFKDKVYSFVGEMVDIWELNCKEKLHSFLVQMLDFWKNDDENRLSSGVKMWDLWKDSNMDGKKLYSLAVETADLWEDGKGKFNKEKLYTWLAKRSTDLSEEVELFGFLEEEIVFPEDPDETLVTRHEKDWKYVEMVRNDLRLTLDLLNKLEDQGHMHYFMSDVLEMAHDVQLLLHLKDSDPIIFFIHFMKKLYRQNPDLDGTMHTISFKGNFVEFFAKIQLIHQRLQETETRVRKFRGDEMSQINNVKEELVDPSAAYSESDHHAVGLKEDMESLLRTTKATIRIHGWAGSGKTTLAREFYYHPQIVDRFDCRAWVCLSSWKLSRKELLIKLIRQFIDSSERDDIMLIEKMENKALQQMLHQHLQDKPYVLVLDDVSEETYMNYVFFQALPQDERSILLFTTRNHNIRCDPEEDYEHRMKNLDGDKSWQLLLQTAFLGSGDHEGFPKQLEKKGRDMLMRKCDGLPLAIEEVGRHWAEKRRSGSEWEQVVESTMNLEFSETLVALEWTILNMDPEGKACFLRLAFFREGTIIRTEKLKQILIAGGLSGGLSEYPSGLYTLIEDESIVEVAETRFNGLPKTYRFNAVFHTLSIKMAVDEIGFEILKKGVSNRASHEPCHHRVIHCSRDDKFNYNCSSTNQDEHLVSLFLHGGGDLSDISWNHFEQLKVLDMEGFGLKILPEMVGDLNELKYLGLRNNYIQEFPQSLHRLKMIEVLDIVQNFMVEVPDILWEMDRLRHLYMSDIICQKPLKIDALMNLETLTYISVDDWTYEMSDMQNKMTRLRKLGIEEVDGNSNVSKLFASLAKLRSLFHLFLRGFRFRSMPSLDELGVLRNLDRLKLEGRLSKLPSATNFPPHLTRLVLVNSCLLEDPIPTLEKLPKLHYLKLQNAYTGPQMLISSDGFCRLFFLVIQELWNLRNIVKVGEGEMRRIYKLEINSCPYLETVPREFIAWLNQSLSLKCSCCHPPYRFKSYGKI